MDRRQQMPLPEVPPHDTPPAPPGQSDRWGCGMKLLWAYTVFVVCAMGVAMMSVPFFPYEPVPFEQQVQDSAIFVLMLVPAAIFLVMVGVKNLRR